MLDLPTFTRGDERTEVLARARKQAEDWFGGPAERRSAA